MSEIKEQSANKIWRNTIRCSQGINKGKFMKTKFLKKRERAAEKKRLFKVIIFVFIY